jgi:hypothetical protein
MAVVASAATAPIRAYFIGFPPQYITDRRGPLQDWTGA